MVENLPKCTKSYVQIYPVLLLILQKEKIINKKFKRMAILQVQIGLQCSVSKITIRQTLPKKDFQVLFWNRKKEWRLFFHLYFLYKKHLTLKGSWNTLHYKKHNELEILFLSQIRCTGHWQTVENYHVWKVEGKVLLELPFVFLFIKSSETKTRVSPESISHKCLGSLSNREKEGEWGLTEIRN